MRRADSSFNDLADGTGGAFTDAFDEFALVYANRAEQDNGHLRQAISDCKIAI